MERDTALLVPLAKHFNLSLSAFGQKIPTVDGPTYGAIELSDAFGTALEPAPQTPTGPESEPYKLLSGTIISTYQASPAFKESGKTLVVAPGISPGKCMKQLK
jgi:Gly-Xaa carboxypeptidase